MEKHITLTEESFETAVSLAFLQALDFARNKPENLLPEEYSKLRNQAMVEACKYVKGIFPSAWTVRIDVEIN